MSGFSIDAFLNNKEGKKICTTDTKCISYFEVEQNKQICSARYHVSRKAYLTPPPHTTFVQRGSACVPAQRVLGVEVAGPHVPLRHHLRHPGSTPRQLPHRSTNIPSFILLTVLQRTIYFITVRTQEVRKGRYNLYTGASTANLR